MPKHHTKQDVIEAIDSFAANAELSADKVKSSLRDFITHAVKKLGGEMKTEAAKVEKKLTGAAAAAAAKKAEKEAVGPVQKAETADAAKTEEKAAAETGDGKEAA